MKLQISLDTCASISVISSYISFPAIKEYKKFKNKNSNFPGKLRRKMFNIHRKLVFFFALFSLPQNILVGHKMLELERILQQDAGDAKCGKSDPEPQSTSNLLNKIGLLFEF